MQRLERTQGYRAGAAAGAAAASERARPIRLYRALRANAITAWRAEAYEEPCSPTATCPAAMCCSTTRT